MSKVLILIGGRHFNDPLHAFSNLYFNRWISLFERGLPFWYPPLCINSTVQLMILSFMRGGDRNGHPLLWLCFLIKSKNNKGVVEELLIILKNSRLNASRNNYGTKLYKLKESYIQNHLVITYFKALLMKPRLHLELIIMSISKLLVEF